MTDDEMLIRALKAVNGLGEELLGRIKKLEQEVRGQKAKLSAIEQIITKQQTNQNLKRRSNGRRVSKASGSVRGLDQGGSDSHPQKA
jgi:hypothetical protein